MASSEKARLCLVDLIRPCDSAHAIRTRWCEPIPNRKYPLFVSKSSSTADGYENTGFKVWMTFRSYGRFFQLLAFNLSKLCGLHCEPTFYAKSSTARKPSVAPNRTSLRFIGP